MNRSVKCFAAMLVAALVSTMVAGCAAPGDDNMLVSPVICTHQCSIEDCLHHECNAGETSKYPPTTPTLPTVS